MRAAGNSERRREPGGDAAAGPYRVSLLGGLGISTAGGAPIELPTRKSRLLVAYLASPLGQAQARNRLSTLFWEDRAEEQARGSLRKALSSLRAAFGAAAIVSDHEVVGLNADLFKTDIACLENLVRAGEDHLDLQELKRLSAPFLEGISIEGSELSDWASFESTRCLSLAQRLLDGAAEQLAKAGNAADALSVAQRLLALDPLREQSHRLLMKIHIEQGERSLALAQFQRCAELLRSELGVEPSRETVSLAQALANEQADNLVQPPKAPAVSAREPSYKYSLAVLPFTNANEDTEQHFFAEGLAEDIITLLSRQKDIIVIARQSSLQRNPADSLESAAEQLGVRYILSGTVRRSSGRIRVIVQLTDTISSRSVWAERYDRPIGDLFDIQDEIANEIVLALDTELRFAERERAARVRPESLDAWELFHRGLWHAYNFTAADGKAAAEFFSKANALDPTFALPYAGLAYLELTQSIWHHAADPVAAMQRGLTFANKALALDSTSPFVQVVIARLLTMAGKIDDAHHHLMFARVQNPNYAHVHYASALAYFWDGRPEEALSSARLAVRLSPHEPLTSMFFTLIAFSQYCLGHAAAAEQSARQAIQLQPRETWARLALAVSLVEIGSMDAARSVVDEARRIDPDLTIASFHAVVRHAPRTILDRIYAGLRAAGLPE